METFKAFFAELFKKAFNSETLKEVRVGAVVVIPVLLVVGLVVAGPNQVAGVLGRAIVIIVIVGILSAAVGAFIRGFQEGKSDHLSAMDEDERAAAGDEE